MYNFFHILLWSDYPHQLDLVSCINSFNASIVNSLHQTMTYTVLFQGTKNKFNPEISPLTSLFRYSFQILLIVCDNYYYYPVA